MGARRSIEKRGWERGSSNRCRIHQKKKKRSEKNQRQKAADNLEPLLSVAFLFLRFLLANLLAKLFSGLPPPQGIVLKGYFLSPFPPHPKTSFPPPARYPPVSIRETFKREPSSQKTHPFLFLRNRRPLQSPAATAARPEEGGVRQRQLHRRLPEGEGVHRHPGAAARHL